MAPYRTIDHTEAQRLLEAGTATVIDVRTPGEYEQLGHIPGAWLLPVDLMASAPAILPDDRAEVLVYCEHGVRSRAASELLAAAGIDRRAEPCGRPRRLARSARIRSRGAARSVAMADRKRRSAAAWRESPGRRMRPRPARAVAGERRLRRARHRSRSRCDRVRARYRGEARVAHQRRSCRSRNRAASCHRDRIRRDCRLQLPASALDTPRCGTR